MQSILAISPLHVLGPVSRGIAKQMGSKHVHQNMEKDPETVDRLLTPDISFQK